MDTRKSRFGAERVFYLKLATRILGTISRRIQKKDLLHQQPDAKSVG